VGEGARRQPPPNSGVARSLFDSPAERYLRARQSVRRFAAAQLGECRSGRESRRPASWR